MFRRISEYISLHLFYFEFMYLVFTRMPGESYRRRLRSLLFPLFRFDCLIGYRGNSLCHGRVTRVGCLFTEKRQVRQSRASRYSSSLTMIGDVCFFLFFFFSSSYSSSSFFLSFFLQSFVARTAPLGCPLRSSCRRICSVRMPSLQHI